MEKKRLMAAAKNSLKVKGEYKQYKTLPGCRPACAQTSSLQLRHRKVILRIVGVDRYRLPERGIGGKVKGKKQNEQQIKGDYRLIQD